MKVPLQKSGVVTLLLMMGVLILIVLYFFFRDPSEVQKRNNTPAASALLTNENELAFTSLNGEEVSLAPYFGDVIVAISWASWCPQCTTDIARLGEVAQVYKEKPVTFLAVNRAEDKYTAERFLKTVTMPAEVEVVLDPEDHYFKNSAAYAMPETIVFGKDGEILLHQRGELRMDELKQGIDRALE